MGEHDHEIDLRYELTVLRGPSPPKDGEIKNGVVGMILADLKSAKHVIMALAIMLLGGVGSVLTWAYLAGQEKGQEKTELRLMRRELDECLLHVRGKNWIADTPRVTPDP
jgi:hypothetical protein